jgi:hypothetical protein
MTVTTTPDPATWPEALRERPVCPHRRLPIPFIAEIRPDGTGEFTIFDADRKRECLTRNLCAMCGAPFTGDVALVGDAEGEFFIEPPVHERCAEIALGGLCPFLSQERVPRRQSGQAAPDGGQVAYVGPTGLLAEVGRTIPKRPVHVWICRSYGIGYTYSEDGHPVMIYLAPPALVVRVRRFSYRGGRLTEDLGDPRPAPPAGPRVQPRRQSRSQRRG